MSVRIIDSLPQLGGQLTALYPEKYIYDMPGFQKVLARELASEMVAQVKPFNPEICLERTASKLDKTNSGYEVITDSGEVLPTRTIVKPWNGAFSPTKIGVEKEASWLGKGLHYGVHDRSEFEGKNIVVVGAGDSALDWCLSLLPIAKSITLVHRRDEFRAHERTVNQVTESSINLKLFYTVHEILGDNEISGVVLQQTQTKNFLSVPCDSVVVNIGFKSTLGPLLTWGLEIEKGAIKVNERFETKVPGVFAIGDGCAYPTKIKLIATGVGEAATAVCYAKTMLSPDAKLFPGHSSDRDA